MALVIKKYCKKCESEQMHTNDICHFCEFKRKNRNKPIPEILKDKLKIYDDYHEKMKKNLKDSKNIKFKKSHIGVL